MSLILLNLDSNQQIKLDNQNPLIIGRKNVEGCFDKRVSRNHGRITCTVDGKLRLEALHFNPCFFTKNGVPPVLQLNKDEEETLGEGDYLGLLPNAFWFKIISDKVTNIKIRPDNFEITSLDQGSEENIRTGNLHDNRSVTNSEAEKTLTTKLKDSSVSNYEVKEGSLNPLPVPTSNSVINSTGQSKGFGSEEFEKTRRLPLWMYEIYDPMEPNRSPNKRPAASTSEKEKKHKPLPVAETDRSSRGVIQVNGNCTDITFPSTSNAKTEDKLQNTMSLKDGTDNDRAPGRRATCENGAMCFIQNPQHKEQFCHPGDEDYVPQVEQPHFSQESSCCEETERNVREVRLESPKTSCKSGHSQDDTVNSPHPLKRSRKRTRVHCKNHNHGSDDGCDDYDDYDDYDDEEEQLYDTLDDYASVESSDGQET